jgi:Zn-dependent protease
MFPSYRLGRLFGFPIRVNLSFVLMLVAVLLWMGGVAGVIVTLMAAGSVLLHELGHASIARHLGVPIAGIELHFFGGAAQMAGTPRRAGDEIAIAAAGPAVSFVLAGLGHGLAAVTGLPLLSLFGSVNLVLALFNLLPAFPSDGGRILRAWLARRRGLVGATDLAVKVGRVVCLLLGVVGLFAGSLQLVLISVVLWMMGGAERLAVRLRGDKDAWRDEATYGLADVPVEYTPPAGRPRFSDAAFPGRGRRVVFVWRD